MLVLPRRDLISTHVSILDSPECKLWVKDSRLHNIRFDALVFSLLALHRHHHKEIVMHRILVLWHRAIVVVRLVTMLIDVLGSRQIKLQHQVPTNAVVRIPSVPSSSRCSHGEKPSPESPASHLRRAHRLAVAVGPPCTGRNFSPWVHAPSPPLISF
jgi:hypothetical protein